MKVQIGKLGVTMFPGCLGAVVSRRSINESKRYRVQEHFNQNHGCRTHLPAFLLMATGVKNKSGLVTAQVVLKGIDPSFGVGVLKIAFGHFLLQEPF